MSSEAPFRIEKLSRSHDQAGFDCGEPSLNEYLLRYARQNAQKGLGATYVAILKGEQRVLAYYTISSGQVAREALPEAEQKALPRYPVPVVRIGRLASDRSMRGQGLEGMMLIDALRRSLAIAEVLGVYAVEVDALDERARAFYEKYGFRALLDDRLHLYKTIKAVRKLLG